MMNYVESLVHASLIIYIQIIESGKWKMEILIARSRSSAAPIIAGVPNHLLSTSRLRIYEKFSGAANRGGVQHRTVREKRYSDRRCVQ